MENEQELLQKAKNGYTYAFDKLVKPYLPSAYRTVYLILHNQSLDDDVFQFKIPNGYRDASETGHENIEGVEKNNNES